ncbi:DUF485 domain-containing protein [Actinoallomurus iriomotensis]|nr:DUF485 domain-containing protein [Actinoallomurus iriomotensis]
MAESPDARYVAINQDERFIVLRRRMGRAVLVVSALFFAWYLLFVVACVFARGLMGHRLAGHVNVALVFGILQFVATFVLARRYSRHSRETLDPSAAQVVADATAPERTGRRR